MAEWVAGTKTGLLTPTLCANCLEGVGIVAKLPPGWNALAGNGSKKWLGFILYKYLLEYVEKGHFEFFCVHLGLYEVNNRGTKTM